jgi:hypothetical protein
MIFNFYINDIEVEEPVGFDGTTIKLKRSDKWHGVMVESNDNKLQFYGDGYLMLKALYDASGIDAVAVFKVESVCEGEQVDSTEFNITFFEYKEYCGGDCYCEVGIERAGCFFKFRNSLDTKVNLDSTATLNGVSLPSYNYLGKVIEVPAQALKYGVEGENSSDIDFDMLVDSPSYQFYFPSSLYTGGTEYFFDLYPPYDVKIDDIDTSNILPSFFERCFAPSSLIYGGAEEIIQNNVRASCTGSDFVLTGKHKIDLTVRMDGSIASGITSPAFAFTINKTNASDTIISTLRTDIIVPTITVHSVTDKTYNYSIDIDYNETFTLGAGEKINVFTRFATRLFTGEIKEFKYTWYANSNVNVSTVALCDSSDAKLYMVNESLSRVTEYNTDNCLQVYSEYLGRPDSAPFEFDTETCAGLMAITKGLLLRGVPVPNNPFSVSFNELITALNTIYPLGYTVENMGVNEVLRVENWDWYYQDMELIDLGDVSANIAPEISLHFKNIKTGYDKYETENYNGLFDIHGEREYTTKLVNHDATIDNICKFVASGYAIELTRQQGDTNSKDWRYDNDTFLLCMRRSGDDIIVEQDNITDDDNILDPPTLLNFRITPARMVSNWFKYITAFMRGVREVVFSSGKGNTLAEGRCISDCDISGNVLAENQNIDSNDIANYTTPIFTAETVEIKGVPVSFRQYLEIKANPHGLVRYTCAGAGAGWIKELKYKIVDGTADFILLKSLRN